MSLSRNKIDTRDDCPRAPAHLEDSSPFVQFTGSFHNVLDASPFYRSPDKISAWSAVFDEPLNRRGSLLLPVSHHGLSGCNDSSNTCALYHVRDASFLRTERDPAAQKLRGLAEYNADNVGWNYVVVPTPAHLSQVGVDNGTPPPRRQYHAEDFGSFALAESPRDVQPTHATEEHMEPSDYSTFSFLYGTSYTVFSHAHSTYSQTG
ncbi:hypothetical protein B0H14DRAFT_3033283 [Mycena olivaceomarginata]|nr:hypothetical protein B0H14DRAFT_3033283 [Mycena olivaceomarginata]